MLSHCVDQAMGSERHPHSDEDYCIFDPHSSYDVVGEVVCHLLLLIYAEQSPPAQPPICQLESPFYIDEVAEPSKFRVE